jgi:hypothetical protein
MCAPRAHGRPLPGRGRTRRIWAHMTGSRARRCRGGQNRLKGVCCKIIKQIISRNVERRHLNPGQLAL